MSHLVGNSSSTNNRSSRDGGGGSIVATGPATATSNQQHPSSSIIEYLDGIAGAPGSYESVLALSSIRSTLLKFIGTDDNTNTNRSYQASRKNNDNDDECRSKIAYSYLVAATKQLPFVLTNQQQQQYQLQQYHLDGNPRRTTTTTTTPGLLVSDERLKLATEIIQTVGKVATYCKSRITESGILAVLSSFITVAIRESSSSSTAATTIANAPVVQCPTLSIIFVEFVQICYIAEEYDIANRTLYNVWPLPNDTRLLSSNNTGGTDVATYYYYRGAIHTMAGIRTNSSTEYELAIRCYETRLTIPSDNNSANIIISLQPLKKLLLVQCLYYTMDDKIFYHQQPQTTSTKKNKNKLDERNTTPSGPAIVSSSSSMPWIDPEFNVSIKEQASISLQKLLPVPISLPKEIPESVNKFLKEAFTIVPVSSNVAGTGAVVGSGSTSSASSTSVSSVTAAATRMAPVPAPLPPITAPSPQDGSNDIMDDTNPEVMHHHAIDSVIESTASPMSEEDIAIESTDEINITTTTTTTAAGEPQQQYPYHRQQPPPKVRIAESTQRQSRQSGNTTASNNERTLLLENVKVYYDFVCAFMNVDRTTITNMLSSTDAVPTTSDGPKRLTPRQIFEMDENYEIVKHCEQALLRRHILLLSTMFSVVSLQDIQQQIKVQSIDEVRSILQELTIQYNWPIEINPDTNYVKFPRFTPTLSLPSHSQRLQELSQLQTIIQQRDCEIATSPKFINYLHKVSSTAANKKGKKNQQGSSLPASVIATGPRGVEDF